MSRHAGMTEARGGWRQGWGRVTGH